MNMPEESQPTGKPPSRKPSDVAKQRKRNGAIGQLASSTLNSVGINRQFSRIGRDADGLKYAWLNPWRRIQDKSRGKRKLNDVENALGQTSSSDANANGVQQRKRDRFRLGKSKNTTGDQKDEGFTWRNQIRRTLLGSPINFLLLAAPAGIALWALKIPGPAVFVVNFIAIIPLASLLAEATEEVAMRTGESLGGLINATFGNAVELIVAVIALLDGQITVVQTSLVGSMLSNLLLVLGCCFFFGGAYRPEQHFQHLVAQTTASLLSLSVASLIVPTIFSHTPDFSSNDEVALPKNAVWEISHGVSVILLLVYGAYLFFQLKTHASIFMATSQKIEKRHFMSFNHGEESKPDGTESAGAGTSDDVACADSEGVSPTAPREDEASTTSAPEVEDDDEKEEPRLHFFVAIGTLLISTVIIAICSEGLVSGIDSIAGSISEEFIGLILLPIVGNACEHATAVTVAIKDKMDLAIGVAIGSSLQIALFVLPLLVIVGWGIGDTRMTLAFDTFQVVVLFISVLLVNYLISDGKSHWLEGVQLITLYVIIALCAFFYPNSAGADGPAA